MFARPLRPFAVSCARALRPVAAAAPRPQVRFTSGYGNNTTQPQGNAAQATPGSVNPEYSGPSITEKKTGRAVVEKDNDTTEPMSNDSGKTGTAGEWRGKQKKKGIEKQHEGMDKPADNWSNSAQVNTTKKREFHTSAYRSAPIRDSDDLMEEASRLKDKASSKMEKGVLAAKYAGADIKESLKDGMHKIKKATKNAGQTLSNVASAAAAPLHNETDHDPIQNHRKGNTPMETRIPKGTLYPTSDSGNSPGDKGTVRAPLASSDEDAAARSNRSVGTEMHSVKKSLFDGPQEMPQGVGKRAKDAEGEPMESGAKST